MNTEHTFEIQQILESTRNYNGWIFSHLEPWLGRCVLDIGSGYGNITQFMLEPGRRVVSVDIEDEYVQSLRERYGARGLEPYRLNLATEPPGPLQAIPFDTVTCVNVLEHIEDDVRFLKIIRGLLVPGGRVALLVPAFQMIFGTMDPADGHYRRYHKADLAAKVEAAGFRMLSARYMNLLGWFGWLVNGRIFRKTIIPKHQAKQFDKIVPVLRRLEGGGPPFGQSLIVAAERPA